MLESTREKVMAGESPRIGIMGGTFDPIHYGHLAAARAVYEALDLDEVVFIPAGLPYFKRSRQLADGYLRYAMCCKAIEGVPEYSANAIEISRAGSTYTVDTLPQLQKGYRNNAQLFFIVGYDAALTLPRWRQSEQLAKMATYVVIKRPNVEFSEADAQKLRDMGFDIVLVDVDTPDISSTEIRRRVEAGESISDLVPPAVEEVIRKNGLYLPEGGIDDPLSDEFFEARKQDLLGRVNEHRYQHILGVSETAVRLAETYDVDVRKARIAGLLHDWDKNYDDDGIRARVDELNVAVPPYVYAMLPRVLHAHTAAKAMEQAFPRISTDVIQAIDRHTIAATDMTPLDMVIYIADALEPNRVYPDADMLRSKIGVVSLEELFFLIYEYWIMRMMDRHMLLHPNTVDIWNTYAARQKAREKEDR